MLVILHEGIHQRKNLRISQDGIQNYQGYEDHYTNPYYSEQNAPGDLHHNQMAEFNRSELIDGMKEFDKKTNSSHSEDWYEGMSWMGLDRTESWNNFEKQNPEKAKIYQRLQSEEIQKMEVRKQQILNKGK